MGSSRGASKGSQQGSSGFGHPQEEDSQGQDVLAPPFVTFFVTLHPW